MRRNADVLRSTRVDSTSLFLDHPRHLSCELEEAGTYESTKTHAGENPAACGRGKVTPGKPDDPLLVRRGITAGKPSAAAAAVISHSLLSEDRHRRCDIDLLAFDPKINGCPGHIMEHSFAKFGDLAASVF